MCHLPQTRPRSGGQTCVCRFSRSSVVGTTGPVSWAGCLIRRHLLSTATAIIASCWWPGPAAGGLPPSDCAPCQEASRGHQGRGGLSTSHQCWCRRETHVQRVQPTRGSCSPRTGPRRTNSICPALTGARPVHAFAPNPHRDPRCSGTLTPTLQSDRAAALNICPGPVVGERGRVGSEPQLQVYTAT